MPLKIDFLKHSEALILNVKLEKNTLDLQKVLAKSALEDLRKQLNNDAKKKTFWINCYNAFFQILALNNQLNRKTIFKEKSFTIAQTKFCLDDIEHGILRKFRYKWSLGFFPNLFIYPKIKKLAVLHLDFKIHFALNCGVKSCPPIAFYNANKIDAQLYVAMQSYIINETIVFHKEKTIRTSKLFLWYLGDFGGINELKKIIGSVFNFNLQDYKISFKDYDYEVFLKNYSKNS